MVDSELSPRVVTVDEAAKILRLGRQSVYEAVHRREIPALRIGRRLVIPLAALDRLLAGETEHPHRD
jgi:excisionase family DNA binding protein